MHWNIHNDSDWMAKDKLAVLLLAPLANIILFGNNKVHVAYTERTTCACVYMHVFYGTEFTGCFDSMERVCQSGRL